MELTHHCLEAYTARRTYATVRPILRGLQRVGQVPAQGCEQGCLVAPGSGLRSYTCAQESLELQCRPSKGVYDPYKPGGEQKMWCRDQVRRVMTDSAPSANTFPTFTDGRVLCMSAQERQVSHLTAVVTAGSQKIKKRG